MSMYVCLDVVNAMFFFICMNIEIPKLGESLVLLFYSLRHVVKVNPLRLADAQFIFHPVLAVHIN